MLIIVNSTPKSGSTWFYSFVRECLARAGHAYPQLPFLNRKGNPGAIEGKNLEMLLVESSESTFVIKAHRPPNPDIVEALGAGKVRSVFLVRHPVAMVRSALAYAEHCRSRPDLEPDSPYTGIYTSEHAADFIEPFIPWAAMWQDRSGNRVLRYEELFSDEAKICEAAMRLIGDIDASIVHATFADFRLDRLDKRQRDGLRVNIENRPELDAETTARCIKWAADMGYADNP